MTLTQFELWIKGCEDNKTIKAKTAGCGEADVIEFDRVNGDMV